MYHHEVKYKDIITCKAVAVSNATVGLTALLRFKNSKTRSILSIRTCEQRLRKILKIRMMKTTTFKIEKFDFKSILYNSSYLFSVRVCHLSLFKHLFLSIFDEKSICQPSFEWICLLSFKALKRGKSMKT